jgi:hypothetical protein
VAWVKCALNASAPSTFVVFDPEIKVFSVDVNATANAHNGNIALVNQVTYGALCASGVLTGLLCGQ